jgi:hypothetical protein
MFRRHVRWLNISYSMYISLVIYDLSILKVLINTNRYDTYSTIKASDIMSHLSHYTCLSSEYSPSIYWHYCF